MLKAGRCRGLQGRRPQRPSPRQPQRARRRLSRNRHHARARDIAHYPDVDLASRSGRSRTRYVHPQIRRTLSRLSAEGANAMTNFKLEIDADGIALVTWDMPGRSMNVLDAEVLRNSTVSSTRPPPTPASRASSSPRARTHSAPAPTSTCCRRSNAQYERMREGAGRGSRGERVFRGAAARPSLLVSPDRDLRQAVGRRDQRHRPRRRLRARARLPLPRRRR